MKTILLVHGPNLNKLGRRDTAHYGHLTLSDIETAVRAKAQGYNILSFQSNHEGALIDFIQAQSERSIALIINPGALTHYSYALHDAIIDSQLFTIEVHLSNILEREAWRAISVISPACVQTIMGKLCDGYLEAIDIIMEKEHAHQC